VFAVFYPVFLIAAIAQATPVPAPQASTVPEIGRTQSKSICARIAGNTLSTVDAALRNDANIERLAALFRQTTPGMFRNAVAKANWEKLATHFATEMYNDLKSARAQLDEMRDIAAKLPDSELKDDTNAYIDALDKSQGDQAKISRRILVSLALGNGRALAQAPVGDPNALTGKGGEGTMLAGPPDAPIKLVDANQRTNGYLQVAEEIVAQAHDIILTENVAAPHAAKLLSACDHPAPSPEPSP
jgi:hypothetical protein